MCVSEANPGEAGHQNKVDHGRCCEYMGILCCDLLNLGCFEQLHYYRLCNVWHL